MHGERNARAQSEGKVGILRDRRERDHGHTDDTVFAKDSLVLGNQLDFCILPVLEGAIIFI